MEKEEIAQVIHSLPCDTTHPEGQRFKIGDVVKIASPQSWFAKAEVGQVFRVRYSYYQKYGWMNGYAEEDKHSYSLTHCATNVSSAWYYEEELELL